MKTLFSIITPTHKRKDGLVRAIDSVLAQTYSNWEMIIVNDSPHDEAYFSLSINDARIKYFVNEKNMGVNYSRDRALKNLSQESTFVIFLDDDDYLAPDTLSIFLRYSQQNPFHTWFMSNRALPHGESLTVTPSGEGEYSYMLDYLITKKIKGDATHCIKTSLIESEGVTFLRQVKQGEEWFFYYQISLHSKIIYIDHNSTISGGYEVGGLNFRTRTLKEYYVSLLRIFYETVNKKKVSFLLLLYITLRILKPLYQLFK
ncbi:MAG: putative glycosyl transferase [Candidatus Parcubacteria bacterium]|jgi:glycosyltransferase involved in cell wall biosynthesis